MIPGERSATLKLSWRSCAACPPSKNSSPSPASAPLLTDIIDRVALFFHMKATGLDFPKVADNSAD
jgi:hypothetical protein